MRIVMTSVALACFVSQVSPALAGSTFQQTCSNIVFAYSGSAATIQAVCLRADGSPNQTSLTLNGIGNNNGTLVLGSGSSTFQQSCGNIGFSLTPSDAKLTAFCRTGSGGSNATSLSLNNIGNNNGNLTQ